MKIIVLTGLLATGKSSVCDCLRDRLHIVGFKKDTIKEKLADEIGFSTREENRKLSLLAISMMNDYIRDCCETNIDVVVDANFRNEEILAIKDIAVKYNATLFVYFFEGDYEVLYKRFLSRCEHRHPAHLSQGLDKDFNKYIEYNETLKQIDESLINKHIDTTNNSVDEVTNIILSDIK